MKSARTNVADNCGGAGPRYSLDPARSRQVLPVRAAF